MGAKHRSLQETGRLRLQDTTTEGTWGWQCVSPLPTLDSPSSHHSTFVAEAAVESRAPKTYLIFSLSYLGSYVICLGKPIKEIQFP